MNKIGEITDIAQTAKEDRHAFLDVTLTHPNGHRLHQRIGITIESFAPVSWREIEHQQLTSLVMSGREPRKEDLVKINTQRREKVLKDAVSKIAFNLAQEMIKRESDAYDPWNK